MDYYGPMLLFHCFRILAAVAFATATAPVMAQLAPSEMSGTEQAAPTPVAADSGLDAQLFYELLLGELNAQSGDPGKAYALILEAARHTNNAQLYQRATDIALQSRSGDYALAAAKAWQEAQPQSREANRAVLQILIALNRIGETPELLRRELAQSPSDVKLSSLAALAQIYSRASDKVLAAHVVEQALADELAHPATGSQAWVVLGQMRLAAGDKPGALQATQKAYALNDANENTVELALQLLEQGVIKAEPIVALYLEKKPSAVGLRMDYARVLLGLQRYGDATRHLERLTREKPELAEPWLVLATLQLQDNQLGFAEKSLQQFIQLISAIEDIEARQRGLTQAYLLYAQIAERQKKYSDAQDWLDRIDQHSQLFSVQTRRASLLARQGKLEQARELLRSLPGTSSDEVKMKLLAQVQLLRDHKLYREAYELQTEVVGMDPEDNELVYDQAMLADKLGQHDVMEKILRQIIARQPKYHHAYNALGYSLAERGLRMDEAKQLITKALELAPSDPFITDSLGWAEFRMGNATQAERLLDTAFKARPDAEIAAHLGEVLWSMGAHKNALSIWKEGLRLNPESDTLRETLKRLKVNP